MKPIFSYRDFHKKRDFIDKTRDFYVDKKDTFVKFIKKFYKTPSLQKIQIHKSTSLQNTPHKTMSKIASPHNKKSTSPSRINNPSPQKNTINFCNHGKRFMHIALRALLIFTILSIIFIIGIFIYFSKDLPEPGKVNTRFIAESTKIYDRTGDVLLYDIHGEEKRTIIPLEDIPKSIKHATIAIEDRDFYNHHGIKIKAIVRAFLSQTIGIGVRSGGSTITQQLVKNSILTDERSITRKIKEAILAIEIEFKFSKDEILGMYLNEIPYGSNAYGVEAAAQTFFAKNARDLTYDEAAILASLPQAPSRYSPYGSKRDLLKDRQEYTIDQIIGLSYLSLDDGERYKSIDVFAKIAKNHENIKAPHMVMYVREYLDEVYGEDYLKQNGLIVRTTLDWEKQQIAERIVKEKAFTNKDAFRAENAALIAIDPKNGEILTMVGSRDYFDEEIDGQVNVATRERQPGSSFKPYVYLLAFIDGYTPETILFDVKTDFEIADQSKDYTPQNYDGHFRGPVKMKDALALSLNIPAVKTLYLVDVKKVIDFVKKLGISTLTHTDRYGLALVLGGGEVKLLEHTAAFSVFANNGIKNEHHAILTIHDKENIILEDATERTPTKIIDKKYTDLLTHILSTNAYRVPAFGENNALRFDDRPVAAKTGTTNENRDAWTMGYTPRVAIGVWAGNNDNRPMNHRGVGANAAAPIFRDFLLEAYPDASGESFAVYDTSTVQTHKDILDGKHGDETEIDVCLISKKKNTYCKENKFCPDDRKKERTFIDAHNILHYIHKDDPRGNEPENPEDDMQYDAWEDGIKDYYGDRNKVIIGDEPEECTRDNFGDYKPEISIDLTQSENHLEISVDQEVPFDTEKITYFIDGSSVKETRDQDYVYTIPIDKNNSTITVRVHLEDVIGNTTEKTSSIAVSF